jgi:hypothetical protein
MGKFIGSSKVKNRFFKTNEWTGSNAVRIRFEKTVSGEPRAHRVNFATDERMVEKFMAGVA